MRNLKKALMVFLYIDLLFYLACAFHQLTFNPLLWTGTARFFLVICFGITLIILGIMGGENFNLFDDKDEKGGNND